MLVHDPNLTPEEHRLRDLMSTVSEACWNAGWESETEFHVWRLATEGGSWGRGEASSLRETLDEILAMARKSGTWVVWQQGPGSDNKAVSLTVWEALYGDWIDAHG